MSLAMSQGDVERAFEAFAAERGWSIIAKADGQVHRFDVIDARGRRKRERGWYILFADGYPNGIIADHADGGKHEWRAEGLPPPDPAMRAELARQRQAAAVERDAARAAQHARAASLATAIWDHAPPADPSNPYLAAKKLSGRGFRRMPPDRDTADPDRLVVAIFNIAGAVVSYQVIDPGAKSLDGETGQGRRRYKKNLWGGQKQGCFQMFGAPPAFGEDSTSPIVICEGPATAAAIAESFEGLCVLGAMDCGNLSHVAAAVRARDPQRPIVIAADDDPATKGNPGLTMADQAARAVRGAVAVPILSGWAGDDGAPLALDFSDLFAAGGPEAVRALIEPSIRAAREAICAEVEPPTDEEIDDQIREEAAATGTGASLHWSKKLTYSRTGELHSTVYNAVLFLENHPATAGMFLFDDFRKKICLTRRPPWAQGDWPAKGNPPDVADVTDIDAIGCAIWLQSKKVKIKTADAWDALLHVAQRRVVNPVHDHINGLLWDGVPRLDTWLRDLYGAHDHITDGVRINRVYGRKWLISMVARIFEPGCQVDHMLVLEGGEGIRKSTGLRELATIGARTYFDDERLNLKDKDSSLSLEGLIIREVAELSGIKGAATEAVKAFITRRHDRVRPPYGRTVREHPRTCVLAGTTNEFAGWIDGATGARRFWPVRCTKQPTVEAIRAVKDQLIAEAAVAYRAGEAWWIEDATTIEAARNTVDARMSEHPWTPDILKFVAGLDEVQTRDILTRLGVGTDKRSDRDAAVIGRIMRQIGWQEAQVRRSIDGAPARRVRVWIPKGEKEHVEPPPAEPDDAAPVADQAEPEATPDAAAPAEPKPAPGAADPAIVPFPGKVFRVGRSGPGEWIDRPDDDDDDPDEAILRAAEALRPEDVQPIAGKPAWRR